MDLFRGTLDLLILKTLSWEPMHGLAIVRWLETVTHERLQVEEGALYPALHRLEARGWLDAAWGYTEAGRRARYYRLTPAGRRQLATQSQKWSEYADMVAAVVATRSAR
jgi:PadR family transcriptional regulator, regulatory protein PadR